MLGPSLGPGTGVAPFRGFIQTRRVLAEQGKALGETHLYFGCRHPEQNFLYEKELKKAEQEGLITLHTAFSRQENCKKTYVQHMMKQNAERLVDLLNNGGYLYICGDGSKMAPQVTETMIRSYQDIQQTTYKEAVEWLENLEKKGRFAKDVWAGA